MWDALLNALVTLVVTIDPFGLAPMFAVLTAGMPTETRRQIATRSIVTSFAILCAFALVGEALISFLGISISAFRIAGGLLLFWIAFEMVFELRRSRKASTLTDDKVAAALAEDEERHDIAIFPLAVPLTAGPGAISATILLASQHGDPASRAGLILIVGLVLGATYLAFLLADPLGRLLGVTGRTVTSRLLGVILAALAVQFVADGVLAFAHGAR